MSVAPALAWRLLRAEGPRSLFERLVDRRRDAARQRSFPPVSIETARQLARGATVLNLIAAPPWRRLGGVPQQLLARLEAEAERRTVALLFPQSSGWRLEIQSGGRRGACRPVAGPAGLEAAVRAALELTPARVLHVEGLAGFDLAALARATSAAEVLAISLHDFSAVRSQLHLSAFDTTADRDRAQRGASLLASARAVVFSSDFLRREHQRLLSAPEAALWRVVEPALRWQPVVPSQVLRQAPRNIAFVGVLSPHKGAAAFERIHAALADRRGLRWSTFGGSGADPAALLRLRRSGVRVHGYYRAGSLPDRLVGARVDLALLLSIWPEAYGLTLDECRLAGVPAICFDHGAPADRIRAQGGGLLVDPAEGAPAVSALLDKLLAGHEAWPRVPPEARSAVGDPDRVAQAMAEIYGEI